MEIDVAELAKRIEWQCGMDGDDEWAKRSGDAWSKKVVWMKGADFGSKVAIISDGFPTDYGYLMTLPPYATEPEMHGVIHLPHTWGEKCDSGPVWLTISDMALLDTVTRIEIG